MTATVAPVAGDRMAGRYYTCCGCTSTRNFGPDCWGGPTATRSRRKVEKRQTRRYVNHHLGSTPVNPLADPSDCRHGCNGDCERHGSDICTFMCHPSPSGPAAIP